VLKKSVTYENPVTGRDMTEEFYFHISKADLVRMDVEEHKEKYTAKDGVEYTGMLAKLNRIVEAEDGKQMMPLFEDIIRRSYGRKDGDRFIRTEEIWLDFKGSGAFDELLFELCTKPDAAGDFINGIMPGGLAAMAEQLQSANGADSAPAPNREQRRASKRKPAARKPGASVTKVREDGLSAERVSEIAQASVDEPVTLAQSELANLEPEDLQTGLASGKYKLGA
jgi:hypothetical protein